MNETPFMHLSNNLDKARFIGPDALVKIFKNTFRNVLQKMDAYFLEHDYYSIVDYNAIVEQFLNGDGYYHFCADDTKKENNVYGRCYIPSEKGSYIVMYEFILNNPIYREAVLCHEFIHMLTICYKQRLVFKKGEKKKICTCFLPNGKYKSTQIDNLTKHTFKKINSKNPLLATFICEGFTELLCNKIYPDTPRTYFAYRKLIHLLNSLTGEENNIQDFLRGELSDLESILGKKEILKIVEKSEELVSVMPEYTDRVTEHREFSGVQLSMVISAINSLQANENFFNARNIINFCGALGVNASEMLNGFGPRTYAIKSVKEILYQLIAQKTQNDESLTTKYKELLVYSLFHADKLAKSRLLTLFEAHIPDYEKNLILEELSLPDTISGTNYRRYIEHAEQDHLEIFNECTALLDNFDMLPYLKIVAKNCGLENVKKITLLTLDKNKKFLLLDVEGYEPIYFPIYTNNVPIYTKSTTTIQNTVPLYSTKLDENGIDTVCFNTGKMVNEDSVLITFTDNTKLIQYLDENDNTHFGIPVLCSSSKKSKIIEISSETLFSERNNEIRSLIANGDRENVDYLLDAYISKLLTPTETTTEILDGTEELLKVKAKKDRTIKIGNKYVNSFGKTTSTKE